MHLSLFSAPDAPPVFTGAVRNGTVRGIRAGIRDRVGTSSGKHGTHLAEELKGKCISELERLSNPKRAYVKALMQTDTREQEQEK